jgi:hypothetical protein
VIVILRQISNLSAISWNEQVAFDESYEKKINSMVNNSTDINKTNNHFSPQIIENKKTTTNDVRNLSSCLEQTQKSDESLDF